MPATGIKGGAGPSKYKGKGASATKVKKVNARHTLYLLAEISPLTLYFLCSGPLVASWNQVFLLELKIQCEYKW